MSAIYPRCRAKFEQGQINLLSDTIQVAATSTGFNAGHEFLSSLALVGQPATLTNKQINAADGMFSAGSLTLQAATGVVNALVIFKATGNPATSPLIAYIDTMAGLPANLSNEPLVIVFPPGGIFYV